MGKHEDEPSLVEAWEMLGSRLGLAVEARSERSVRATGTVRGRPVLVEVEGAATAGKQFLRGLFGRRGGRIDRQGWTTLAEVGCANPAGLAGTIRSAVDINNPAWDPRNFDPAHCRAVATAPPELAQWVLTPSTYERLMSITGDVDLQVDAGCVRLAAQGSSAASGGFVAGSLLHHPPTSGLPWPDRALAGPIWWLELMHDVAEAVDRHPPR